MSFVAPNSFTSGTKINADEVEENINALQAYVNGGVSTVDFQSADWVKTQHVMKGEYIPLSNIYEMTTGISGGTLGSNEEGGYSGNILGNIQGQSESASNTSIDFYMEYDGDVLITIVCHPRAYSQRNTATVQDDCQTDSFTVDSDLAPIYGYNTTRDFRVTEASTGIKHNGTFNGGIFGGERRKPYVGYYNGYFTQGQHSISLKVGAGDRQIPIFYYQASVRAYYRA